MFSYEQAAAVTEEQLSALSDVQRTALAMVLTPWEDRPVDFRGELLKSFKLLLSTNICNQNPTYFVFIKFTLSGEDEETSLKALNKVVSQFHTNTIHYNMLYTDIHNIVSLKIVYKK